MNTPPTPRTRARYAAAWLMVAHPPVWWHPNKQAVFEVACPAGSMYAGDLDYSRWAAIAAPAEARPAVAAERLVGRPGFYDYAPEADLPGATEWHVNFADPSLFAFYGSALFAQDELQVAEHPALGALREALVADGQPAVTVERGQPTPVLVMGVERRCAVTTESDAAAGRPAGL